jgi:hypothetical protein
MIRIELFTDCTPNNYINEDNMKHYQFKDYKHLEGVNFEDEETPLSLKVLGSVGFIMTLLLLLFI